MGTIYDYTGGKVLEDIAKALDVFRTIEGPLSGTDIGQRMLGNISKFEPVVVTIDEAVDAVHKADKVAVGARICRALHVDSVFTESVFVDELADAMVQESLAEKCSAEEAEYTLKKYPKYPLIISKVSGKHQEICRSYPSECVYWLAEKRGLQCLKKNKD